MPSRSLHAELSRPNRALLAIVSLLGALSCNEPSEKDDTSTACVDPYGETALSETFHLLFPGEGWSTSSEPILPSDYYLIEAEGRYQVTFPEPVLDLGFDHVDGFPTFIPISLLFSDPADPATITPDRFLLFQVDPSQKELRTFPLSVFYRDSDDFAYVVPEEVLPEGATIALAVLDGITSMSGEPLSTPAVLECTQGGWTDPDHTLLSVSVQAAFQALSQAGTDSASVRWLNTFHTGRPHAALSRAMQALETSIDLDGLSGEMTHILPARDLDNTLTNAVLSLLPRDYQPGGAYSSVETFVQGSFELPDVQGSFYTDSAVTPSTTSTVPFTLLIPPLQEGGELPVIIYLHGISSCRETVFELSETFNGAGYALAALDASAHYQRFDPEAEECGDYAYSLAYIDFTDVKSSVERFAMDGLGTLAFERYLSASLPTLLDQLSLEQGIETAPTPGTYHRLGHSLGGIHASVGMSVLPQESLASGSSYVGTAAGGGLALNLLAPLAQGLFSEEPFDWFNLNLYTQLETALWLGDPLVHAPWVQADTLIQAAENDDTIPNGASEMLALTQGIPLLEPVKWDVYGLEIEPTPVEANLESERTAGLFEFSPATHNLLFSSVDGDPDLVWRVQQQALLFFQDGIIQDAYSLTRP